MYMIYVTVRIRIIVPCIYIREQADQSNNEASFLGLHY